MNLRTGASNQTAVVGSLGRGEVVQAAGKVPGAPCIMISRTNITFGYVHASLFAALVSSVAQQQPVLTGTFEFDDVGTKEVNRKTQATFEGDDQVKVGDAVKVMTDCRTVDIEIVAESVTESVSTPPGDRAGPGEPYERREADHLENDGAVLWGRVAEAPLSGGRGLMGGAVGVLGATPGLTRALTTLDLSAESGLAMREHKTGRQK